MSTHPETYERVFHHPTLNKIIDILLYNRFIQNIPNSLSQEQLPIEDLRKAVWLASLLVSSQSEIHQSKAQLFSSLLYLQMGEKEDIEKVCYVLMARLGNLTATQLFKSSGVPPESELENPLQGFDALLSYELSYQNNIHRIQTSDEEILATRFQKQLWTDLITKKRLSISAPTSSGKSFIAKKHIKLQFIESKVPRQCLYIVPSRALINQVSDEFRVLLKDVANVHTSFMESNFEENAIYILTPERCLRLLKVVEKTKFNLDLIFVDEIQNVEDENGRGTLLEFVVASLNNAFPNAQFIVAGPNIDNPTQLFNVLMREGAEEIRTQVSPVIQIRSVIRAVDSSKISVKLLSNIQDNIEFIVDIGHDLEKALNSNIGIGLSGIIQRLAKSEQSLIYSPKTNLAETWARHYTNENDDYIIDRRLSELIEYLSDEIHPLYYLIKCLKKGVAFHHGRLPEMVRKEVEDCFSDGQISKLFCTSTLIEGVNLPARNLFVIIPQKLDTDLSPFEFGNLVGRAGRIGDSLYGNVYCIERAQNHDWAKKYFEASFVKSVRPSTSKALESFENLITKIHLPSNEFERDAQLEKNSIILFRHKLYSNKEEFISYLQSKGVEESKVNLLIDGIEASLEGVSIPDEISRNNPSIDILLQNKLYIQIVSEGIEEWVIHPNGNLAVPISKDKIETYPVKERNLYWQLLPIMEKLDKIFDIKTEAGQRHQVYRTIPQMCLYGVRWLAGDTYSQIVKDDIAWRVKTATEEYPFDPTSESEINKIINNLSKINNTIVSNILVKYTKLLNDILEKLMTEKQLEDYKFSMALPGMLELGTTNGTVIKLISVGVSRSVAIKVNLLFSKVEGNEDIDIFAWLKSKSSLNLKPIYNRYLSKIGLLKREDPKSKP